jgi:mycothiol system anti-sigma-R factor
MSTGHCEEVVRLLWQYMDRELDPETARRLEEHVRGCQRCERRHEFEARLRAIVQQKCAGRPAPEALRRRVLALLADL